jgi:glycine cleavage system H protein
MYPSDRHYSKEHEWVAVSGDEATLGITHYAQDQLGDIVYVELPEQGAQFGREEVLGTIESVKAVSEFYAPITGTVTAVNRTLDERPEQLNADPHGEGWYCKLKLSDPAELEGLMDAEGYQKFVDSQ